MITDGPFKGHFSVGPIIGSSMDFMMGTPRTDFDAKEVMDEKKIAARFPATHSCFAKNLIF